MEYSSIKTYETIINLKKKVDAAPQDKVFDIDLTYLTSREIGIIHLGKEIWINQEALQLILVYIFMICYLGYLVR